MIADPPTRWPTPRRDLADPATFQQSRRASFDELEGHELAAAVDHFVAGFLIGAQHRGYVCRSAPMPGPGMVLQIVLERGPLRSMLALDFGCHHNAPPFARITLAVRQMIRDIEEAER